jgi:hypothetical protein
MRMNRYRILLIAAGLLPLAWGLFGIATTVPPAQILGLVVWLAGSVVLHDGFLVPLMLIIGASTVLLTRRLSRAGRYLIRLALLIGGTVLLVVLPLIYTAPHTGTPTALTLPYGRNLLLFLLVLAGATTAGVLMTEYRRRRTNTAEDFPGSKAGAPSQEGPADI